MRFSVATTLAVAFLASDAAAWKKSHSWSSSSYWEWRNNQGSGSGTIAKTSCGGQKPAAPTNVEVEQPVYTTPVAAPVVVETTVVTMPEETPVAEAPAQAPSASPAPAPAPAPATGNGEPSGTDQQNAFAAHNKARAEAGVKDLAWDKDLAAAAQEWADHLASINSMTHSKGSGQGENLYAGSLNNPYTSAADLWIAEKSKYSGQPIDGNYGVYGHYTQVIWGKTEKVGMGAAKGSDGSTYVVARYYPAGNMIGSTPTSA